MSSVNMCNKNFKQSNAKVFDLKFGHSIQNKKKKNAEDVNLWDGRMCRCVLNKFF